MQIKVNLKIFIFIILFIITKQIKIYGILMWFALLHELGHLLMGIILGFKPNSLSIKPIGLSIAFKIKTKDLEMKVKKATKLEFKKIFIGLAGPIINIILAILYLNINLKILGISQEIGFYSNLLIAGFNLIPIYPLDGGRILKSLLHIFMGYQKAEMVVRNISWITVIGITIFSSFLILYIKNIALVIIIIYLWGLYIKSN